MMRILKEPLLHFLLLGAALFGVFEILNDDTNAGNDNVIVVSRDGLLEYLQFRNKAFDAASATQRLDAMSAGEVDKLINAYVREEALYREAVQLGIGVNDYVIRQRLVQSVEFITEGFAAAEIDDSDTAVAAWFADNNAKYFVEERVTFTHVFIDTQRRGDETARDIAIQLRDDMQAKGAVFTDSTAYGDAFPYYRNYVDRNNEFVTSHFGESFATRVFAATSAVSTWQGPFESEQGQHIVLLTKKTGGHNAVLEDIEELVRLDMREEAVRQQHTAAVAAIVAGYEVQVELNPDTPE